METDIISKLNNNLDAYNESDYVVDATTGVASVTATDGIVPLNNTINTINTQAMPINVAGGIEVNGKSYSADQIEELFEMMTLIKKMYPELVIVK
jgi:hypothetical protein